MMDRDQEEGCETCLPMAVVRGPRRQASGHQQYYFDDFTLFGDDSGGGGGGGSAVPEPNTLFLLSMAGVGIVAIRKQVLKV